MASDLNYNQTPERQSRSGAYFIVQSVFSRIPDKRFFDKSPPNSWAIYKICKPVQIFEE